MMQEHVKDEVDFYGDFSPFFEEESMPETVPHSELVEYLVAVLKWLFRGYVCAVCENLAFFPPPQLHEPPVAPDIAVIKGVPLGPVTSWHVGKTGPAPQVVFEILSAETWKKDVEEKPGIYARMGVQEYFAYNPHLPPLAAATTGRLFGWHLDHEVPRMTPLTLRPDGSLRSSELDSFLVPDQPLLRLYDCNSQLRLTEAEARTRQAEAEAAARRAAERRADALLEKLRSLGLDPDQL